MLVATTFDLWQKDVFFSAAEEVQESADNLRSAYRVWLRAKGEGKTSDSIDELCRGLQTALGTAKWQLEEFERAIRLSYGNCRDENRVARHREFIVAIESQISCVENAIRESLEEGGCAPLCWVNLNDQERDDLAVFLSSNVAALQGTKDESSDPSFQKINRHKKVDADCYFHGALIGDTKGSCNQSEGGVKDDIAVKMDAGYVIGLNGMNVREVRDDANSSVEQTTSSKRTCTSSNLSRLEIIVPGEDEHTSALMSSMQDTPKVKEPRLFGSMHMKALNLINQYSDKNAEITALAFWSICSSYACFDADYCTVCALHSLFSLKKHDILTLCQDDKMIGTFRDYDYEDLLLFIGVKCDSRISQGHIIFIIKVRRMVKKPQRYVCGFIYAVLYEALLATSMFFFLARGYLKV